jgi:hypothetical protein
MFFSNNKDYRRSPHIRVNQQKGDKFHRPWLTSHDFLVCYLPTCITHKLVFLHLISSGNILVIVSKDIWPYRQCLSIKLASSSSLATTVKVVHNASSISHLSMYCSPLCLTPIPTLLVSLFPDIQLYQSITTQRSPN